MDIRLYSTACCHLCEEAAAVLKEAGIEATHVDIAEDDALLDRYGTRIPVLQRLDSGAELGWPFDTAAVLRFLR
jgi:hypothetical protein